MQVEIISLRIIMCGFNFPLHRLSILREEVHRRFVEQMRDAENALDFMAGRLPGKGKWVAMPPRLQAVGTRARWS